MAEKLTAAQIREQREAGDHFEILDDGTRNIKGFNDLIAQIKALVAAQRANAGADMLRSEAQAQLIALLQALVSKPASSLDMSPLTAMITEMQVMNEARPRAAYEFEIDRDGQGFMRKITATPVAPTLN